MREVLIDIAHTDLHSSPFVLILGLLVLDIEPRASYVRGKWCSPDYTLEPPLFISN